MNNKTNVNNSTFEDLISGDKYVLPPDIQALEKAIQAIKTTIDEDPEFEGFVKELAEYTTNRPDRAVVGVEEKLKLGGRNDSIENAIYWKNKFERKVAKSQLSNVEQYIYAHILAAIETRFNQYIRPLIIEGDSKASVDAAIHKHIYEVVHHAISTYDPTVTIQQVGGMLYFLTGKCHITWSE